MTGSARLMLFVILAIGLWSLAGAVRLSRGTVRGGSLWGRSAAGNALQGMGLMGAGLVILFDNVAGIAGGSVTGTILVAAPWIVVLLGVGLRLRARARQDRE